MAGEFPRALSRLIDRFPMVGDPLDSESVSSTLDRVLLKRGMAMWVRAGYEARPPHLFVNTARSVKVTSVGGV